MPRLRLRTFGRLALMSSLDLLFHDHVPTVLMYHSIRDGEEPFFTVKPTMFERQLAYICSEGCNIVTMDDVRSYFERGISLPRKSVCITFDDGYLDNYEVALPILEKFNVKATIYVATGFTGKLTGMVNLPTCGEGHIKELSNHSLITVGAHTHNHPNLSQISIDDVIKELTLSKDFLENLIGKDVLHFAYPKGYYNNYVLDCVKRAGFKTAVTVKPMGIEDSLNQWSIGRVPVDSGVSEYAFRMGMHKTTSIYTNLRGLFCR